MSAIVARNLSKKYGGKPALDEVSFSIEPGRIVGLIGPNGAGKTTALKAILGLTAFEGELSVLGQDPRVARDKLMNEVCFIADVAILPRWIRVSQAIDFVEGVHARFSRAKCEAFLARTKLHAKQRVREMSKGMIVQLHLALVMAIDAKVLVLDEPTLGLDEVAERFTEVLVSPDRAEAARALGPLDERQVFGKTIFLFDGIAKSRLAELGETRTPSVADLFVATMKGTYA